MKYKGIYIQEAMKTERNCLISVIIPTFNRVRSIEKAVMSVLKQTYGELECIVVDDCSTDNTEEIVKGLRDERIRYIKNSKNVGAAKARNIGIKMAEGEFIAFNDSDDIWQENKIELQLELLKYDSNFGMVYCPYYLHAGKQIRQIPPSYIPIEEMQGDIFKRLLKNNIIGTPTILIRRECLERIGEFNEQLFASEDYELVLRVAEKFKIGCVNECLVNAYRLDEGIDSNCENQIKTRIYLLERYTFLGKKELLPMISSAYNYIQQLEKDHEAKKFMEWLWKFVSSIHAEKDFALIQSNRSKMLLFERGILYKLIEKGKSGELWNTAILHAGYKNVAIYGAGKLGIILEESLRENKIIVKNFIDGNNVYIEGYDIVKKENIPQEIDFIIVSVSPETISVTEIQKYTKAKVVNIKDI